MMIFFSVSRFGRLTHSQIVRTFSKNHELLAKVANSQNASIIMILQSPNADEGKRRTDRHIFDSGEKKKNPQAFLHVFMKSVILTIPQWNIIIASIILLKMVTNQIGGQFWLLYEFWDFT